MTDKLTPREWQAVHGLKINALRAALAEQPAEQEPVAWFDADGKIHGRVSKEQLVALCTEALTQLGERYVALEDYKELQALVSSQGIRLMEYESQPIESAGQEPVAEVTDVARQNDGQWSAIVMTGDVEMQPGDKLFAAPQPQREWVGLSEREIRALVNLPGAGRPRTAIEMAYAVQAKLRQKNGGDHIPDAGKMIDTCPTCEALAWAVLLDQGGRA